MSGQNDDTEKSHEATPQKLLEARKKGEVPRSVDLSTAASYAGILLVILTFGQSSVESLGTSLMTLIGQSDQLADLFFSGAMTAPFGGVLINTGWSMTPWFAVPAILVLLSVLVQRSFVVAPTKLKPKLSRISPISNAKNKFGRNGLFEFSKSFVKLVVYSVCLAFFIKAHLPQMLAAVQTNPMIVAAVLARMCIEFLFLVLLIAIIIGGIDAIWQHQEHMRKNRMSRKEVTDETKNSEGDPHMKQHRRQKAQEIAMSQMMGDVPDADVIVVNPTHYAVALKWSRMPGEAPVCVAKGVDEIALKIREVGMEAGVPIQSDPPTARALYATTAIGDEISPDHYRAVAAAIRFAEKMRDRARKQGR